MTTTLQQTNELTPRMLEWMRADMADTEERLQPIIEIYANLIHRYGSNMAVPISMRRLQSRQVDDTTLSYLLSPNVSVAFSCTLPLRVDEF